MPGTYVCMDEASTCAACGYVGIGGISCATRDITSLTPSMQPISDFSSLVSWFLIGKRIAVGCKFELWQQVRQIINYRGIELRLPIRVIIISASVKLEIWCGTLGLHFIIRLPLIAVGQNTIN